MKFSVAGSIALLAGTGNAVSIAQINGDRFQSPYNGQEVANVTGVVTAKSANGIYIRGLRRSCNPRISDSLYLYGTSLAKNASIVPGDIITVTGPVTEYRSSDAYLYLTELNIPKVTKLVKGTSLPKPRVIGKDTLSPPTEQFTSLDNGDVFAVPNNSSQISKVNPVLEPEKYGLDFWESLSGELVTIQNPVAIAKPNQYGETWVVGDWKTSGRNGRGGLTLGNKDGNPEAIIVGRPLDGSRNKDTYKIGDKFESITGIVMYNFGFYSILPTVNITRISEPEPKLPPPTTLQSDGVCSGLTFGDYNIENFSPTPAKHVNDVANHIVTYLKSPDLLFLQEVQDNNGATNNGVVNANVTLETLANAIANRTGIKYGYVNIDPVDLQDGGAPGGNIRVAYLYKTDVLRLRSGTPGGALDANEVVAGPHLKYNPGRIDPTNLAWNASRKPLVAEWETIEGAHNFFTVNVHWSSKGGSSSLHGDPRPPINLPVDQRIQQANVTGSFIAQILAKDPNASVIMAGDCNEYQVAPPIYTFLKVSGMVEVDEAAGIPATERYTYTFGQNMQALDHTFISSAIAKRSPKAEHIHVNTWVNYDDATSDHDPTVSKLNVCKA